MSFSSVSGFISSNAFPICVTSAVTAVGIIIGCSPEDVVMAAAVTFIATQTIAAIRSQQELAFLLAQNNALRADLERIGNQGEFIQDLQRIINLIGNPLLNPEGNAGGAQQQRAREQHQEVRADQQGIRELSAARAARQTRKRAQPQGQNHRCNYMKIPR